LSGKRAASGRTAALPNSGIHVWAPTLVATGIALSIRATYSGCVVITVLAPFILTALVTPLFHGLSKIS